MQQNWSKPADGIDKTGFKAVIIGLISGCQIYQKYDSNRDRDGSTLTIYPSISCDADTRITAEIAEANQDMLINLFHAGSDFYADRSDLRENMFIQRER
jgi:hypothetical protein